MGDKVRTHMIVDALAANRGKWTQDKYSDFARPTRHTNDKSPGLFKTRNRGGGRSDGSGNRSGDTTAGKAVKRSASSAASLAADKKPSPSSSSPTGESAAATAALAVTGVIAASVGANVLPAKSRNVTMNLVPSIMNPGDENAFSAPLESPNAQTTMPRARPTLLAGVAGNNDPSPPPVANRVPKSRSMELNLISVIDNAIAVASKNREKFATQGRRAPGVRQSASTQSIYKNSRELMDQVAEDCFIVPMHRIDRFMPFLPFTNKRCIFPAPPAPPPSIASTPSSPTSPTSPVRMLQIDDPHLCVVLHFAEPLEPTQPTVTLPNAILTSSQRHVLGSRRLHALKAQLQAMKEALKDVSQMGQASEGMLLVCMERNAIYPFIMYMVLNSKSGGEPPKFIEDYEAILNETMTYERSMYTAINHIAGYEEVATIAKPPIDVVPKKPTTLTTGYIISIFKVFPGDDREKFERSWLMWTGARTIYKQLPKTLGLRRISFHKKLLADGGITYMLLCECTHLLENPMLGCGFVEQLRARCCGYTALYKCSDMF